MPANSTVPADLNAQITVPRLLTLEQASAYAQVSRKKMAELIRNREVRSIQVGARVRIPANWLLSDLGLRDTATRSRRADAQVDAEFQLMAAKLGI